MNISKFFSEMNGENIDEESLSATISVLDHEYFPRERWGSIFEKKKCPNGKTVEVLKDPKDAVRAFGKSWLFNLDLVVKAFDQIEIQFGSQIKQQVTEFQQSVEALRESFKTDVIMMYTSYRLRACDPGAGKWLTKRTDILLDSGIKLRETMALTYRIIKVEQIKLILESIAEIKKQIEKLKSDDNGEADDDSGAGDNSGADDDENTKIK